MIPYHITEILFPLTLLIILGWVIGRAQPIDLKSIATVLIYAISPVVALGSVAQMSFQGVYILLPLIVYTLASFCGLTAFALGRKFLKQKDMAYLLPQATGAGNNGYFGLPLAMAIFPAEQIGIYFLMILGTSLFEATIGYYFIGRGHLSAKDAFRRVVKMPVIYSIAAGLVLSAMQVHLDAGALKLWEAARGTYVCMGMMLIGMALAQHKRLAWNIDLISLTMVGKYALWAIGVALFIALDRGAFQLFDHFIYTMLAIFVITPVAANTAAFAAQHDFKPQLAATVVFLTTLVSFAALPFILPVMLSLTQ